MSLNKGACLPATAFLLCAQECSRCGRYHAVPYERHVALFRRARDGRPAPCVPQRAAGLEAVISVAARCGGVLAEVYAAQHVGPPVVAVVVHERNGIVRGILAADVQAQARGQTQAPRQPIGAPAGTAGSGPAELDQEERREDRLDRSRAQLPVAALLHARHEESVDVLCGEQERQVHLCGLAGVLIGARGTSPFGPGGQVEGAGRQAVGQEVVEKLLSHTETVAGESCRVAAAGRARDAPAYQAVLAPAPAPALDFRRRRLGVRVSLLGSRAHSSE
eukprot:scaffold2390_cov125-Isochrysis_galbana.AAC.4